MAEAFGICPWQTSSVLAQILGADLSGFTRSTTANN